MLKYISLRLLIAKAVGDKRILQQGDCKNAFYNSTLPENEVTVIRPPIGYPAFQEYEYWLLKKTLYGLRRSPHHWYNMIKGILLKMGLKAYPHNPCLLSGIVEDSNSQKTISKDQPQLHLGLYVDDLVLYSSDPAHEVLFKNLPQEHIQVDFMGDVDYFLGTAFTWLHHKYGNMSVQLCQSAFTEFTAHRTSVQRANKVPNMTPYRSGLPIDSILPIDPLDPNFNR